MAAESWLEGYSHTSVWYNIQHQVNKYHRLLSHSHARLYDIIAAGSWKYRSGKFPNSAVPSPKSQKRVDEFLLLLLFTAYTSTSSSYLASGTSYPLHSGIPCLGTDGYSRLGRVGVCRLPKYVDDDGVCDISQKKNCSSKCLTTSHSKPMKDSPSKWQLG